MQQYINNHINNREIKMTFRADSEKVALIICQSLCSHFRSRDWRTCSSCPTKRLKRLIKCENGWGINLNKNIVLRLFPAEGRIEIMKGGQLKTWTGISAFSISYDPRIWLVRFYNSQKRPIFLIDRFGFISSSVGKC